MSGVTRNGVSAGACARAPTVSANAANAQEDSAVFMGPPMKRRVYRSTAQTPMGLFGQWAMLAIPGAELSRVAGQSSDPDAPLGARAGSTQGPR